MSTLLVVIAQQEDADVAALVSMGFAEAPARRALEAVAAAGNAPDPVQAAMERMLGGGAAEGAGSSGAVDAPGPFVAPQVPTA
jgi:hypothetical protein